MKFGAVLVSLLLGLSVARADDVAAAGRQIFQKSEQAVLTIKLVINQSFSIGGRSQRKQEEKSEVTGTVISPKGLIVVSLAATDPASTMASLYGGGGDEENRLKSDSTISDIKILLPGGREVPGRIVLRDKDLDLAFILPVDNGKEDWSFVSLKDHGRPALLDPVVVLNRLGQVAGRTASVSAGRVTAMVEKPRTYYVIDHDMGSLSLGSPVFAADGKLLGVLAIRTSPPQGRMGMGAMFSGASAMGLLPVIVPADQIQEAAEQAPEKAPKEEPEAPPVAAPESS